MKNVVVCLILMVSFMASSLVAFSQEDQMIEQAENVSMELLGEVVSIDVENQEIVVEYLLEDSEGTSTVVCSFSDTTDIDKDGESVLISDLNAGDEIAVTYQIDENSANVASRITLLKEQAFN